MNIASARKAEEFVDIITTDRCGRVVKASVPGHRGRSYQVGISRSGRIMTCKCVCADTKEECQGNKSSVCYHVIATLLASAARAKPPVRLSFCDHKTSAQNLVNIAGKMFVLKSLQSLKEKWVVAVQLAAPAQWLC